MNKSFFFLSFFMISFSFSKMVFGMHIREEWVISEGIYFFACKTIIIVERMLRYTFYKFHYNPISFDLLSAEERKRNTVASMFMYMQRENLNFPFEWKWTNWNYFWINLNLCLFLCSPFNQTKCATNIEAISKLFYCNVFSYTFTWMRFTLLL